jgi:soluble lytic murein transglycosylase-like protein
MKETDTDTVPRMPVWPAALVLILALVSAPAAAVETHTPGERRPDPYTATAGLYGIPAWVLYSVVHVESKNHPYAVNHRGRSYFFPDRASAAAFLARTGDDVDVGLGQINCRIWCRRLGLSRFDLLDPLVNLHATARILALAWRSSTDPWEAVGRYHSRRPRRRAAYAWKVYRAALRLFARRPRGKGGGG